METTKHINNTWIECEHPNWGDIKKDGRKFMETTKHPHTIIMTRNGHINSFREVQR